jgi:light-regulated signal transduction histidine kinase (bacteriophytochrome)
MTRSNTQTSNVQTLIKRYGLALLSVAIALASALFLAGHHFQGLEFSLFLFAIALTAWYEGTGPAIFALTLSSFAFDDYVTAPSHSLRVERSEVPYYVTYILFAALVAGFAAIRRRAESELLRTRDDLQAANKELEAFAYSVSHDLRAPLRHMAGFGELLQKNVNSSLDSKNQRYMAMILESANRMGSLIDDLLAFSRIGRVEAQMTLVNLDQLVKEVVAEVKRQAAGREIVWRIDSLPSCYGDRSMLRIVFVNLVSNAVKFTSQRARAEIEIGFTKGSEHEVVIFVRDNGAGFDMKYVEKLFGVFQRLHHADQFEGTGIGLATVQRIIHRHGGVVRAEGSVNHGATFYFSARKP